MNGVLHFAFRQCPGERSVPRDSAYSSLLFLTVSSPPGTDIWVVPIFCKHHSQSWSVSPLGKERAVSQMTNARVILVAATDCPSTALTLPLFIPPPRVKPPGPQPSACYTSAVFPIKGGNRWFFMSLLSTMSIFSC